MIDDRKTQSNDNLISDTTFWDLYPVDLSSVEDVSVKLAVFSHCFCHDLFISFL